MSGVLDTGQGPQSDTGTSSECFEGEPGSEAGLPNVPSDLSMTGHDR